MGWMIEKVWVETVERGQPGKSAKEVNSIPWSRTEQAYEHLFYLNVLVYIESTESVKLVAFTVGQMGGTLSHLATHSSSVAREVLNLLISRNPKYNTFSKNFQHKTCRAKKKSQEQLLTIVLKCGSVFRSLSLSVAFYALTSSPPPFPVSLRTRETTVDFPPLYRTFFFFLKKRVYI